MFVQVQQAANLQRCELHPGDGVMSCGWSLHPLLCCSASDGLSQWNRVHHSDSSDSQSCSAHLKIQG